MGGGADAASGSTWAGLLDEMHLHVVPLLLGDGVRLFDGHLADAPVGLEARA